MKFLTIILLALVGTIVMSEPIQSFADPQLDTLVNIATQAKNNLNINISQINDIPDEITQLYNQGSNETDALVKASNEHNITLAKQHFLSAMKFFKATNDKINSLNMSQTNDQSRAVVMELQSEITRMEKIGERLQTIAITNHANFDFSQFDQLIQKAKQDLDNGKFNDTSKSIETLNQIMLDAHHSLATIAEQRTTDRAKDFTEKQIETLNKTGDLDMSKNQAGSSNITSMSTVSGNLTFEKNPTEMIVKMRKLISEGNVDEGLKVMKSLKAYEESKLTTKTSSEQPHLEDSGNINNTMANSSNHINFDQKENSTKVDVEKSRSDVIINNNFTIADSSNVAVKNDKNSKDTSQGP